MLITGIAFVIVAALIQFALWSVVGALAVVGIALIVLALVLGERFPTRSAS